MAISFGHEKLFVYQKALCFAAQRTELLRGITKVVAACDHLKRAAESIVVNIAHASNTWSPKERITSLGHANGSALECAACLDVLVAKQRLTQMETVPAKTLLCEIVSILVTMQSKTATRICEEQIQYRTKKGNLFNHEDLNVYQAALGIIAWIDTRQNEFSCSSDLCVKLDKATTSIVLNIAEGNGRFTTEDQLKFYRTAHKATILSASLLDLTTTEMNHKDTIDMTEGYDMLKSIAAMLSALSKATLKRNTQTLYT